MEGWVLPVPGHRGLQLTRSHGETLYVRIISFAEVLCRPPPSIRPIWYPTPWFPPAETFAHRA